MLHIILLLFKIIGILLLSVLGLILLILLTTLLVPIRYRVAIKHGENLFYLKGRVNWLLHLLHVTFSHIDGLLHIRARVFGFVVYDNLAPKKPKKPKIAKKKEDKGKVAKRKAIKRKAEKSRESLKASVETPKEQNVNLVGGNTNSWDEIPMNKVAEEQGKSSGTSQDTIKATKLLDEEEEVVVVEEPKNRKSLFKKVLERLQGIRGKATTLFQEWKVKISRIFSTIATFKYKLDLILVFLRDEMNKEGMRVTFRSLKMMLKHILPTKLRSKIIFGTGDPCSTGQALGAMSILYSFYGDKIQIIPDFERNRLEGEHLVMGRIRLGTILIIVVKLIFDKKFKQLKHSFIILKEAL